MAVSYNGLWKLLIDKNLKKTEFMEQVGISYDKDAVVKEPNSKK